MYKKSCIERSIYMELNRARLYYIGYKKNTFEYTVKWLYQLNDGWQHNTDFNPDSYALDFKFHARYLTALAKKTDPDHQGMCDMREKEFLQSLLDWQSSKDEETQANFAIWWVSNGFQKRAQALHL